MYALKLVHSRAYAFLKIRVDNIARGWNGRDFPNSGLLISISKQKNLFSILIPGAAELVLEPRFLMEAHCSSSCDPLSTPHGVSQYEIVDIKY